MSSIKVYVSKNETARLEDPHITYEDAGGTEDINVTFWVNDQEVFAKLLTDEGCWLTWDGTLSQGYHTIKVVPEAGRPTDIRIDKVLIDDHTVVGSQYLMDTRIFGKDQDYLKYKCCKPWRSPKGNDYVWWGTVYNADYTAKSNTTHYRPHVVTDLGEWWEWSFSVTAAGHVHWTVDDSDSILYDSTENHNYYAAKSTFVDDSTFPTAQYDEVLNYLNQDSSSWSGWLGAGTYDDTFRNILTTEHYSEGIDHTSIYSESEWYDAVLFYYMYYPFYNIDPIVVT